METILTIDALRAKYQAEELTPRALILKILSEIQQMGDSKIWIHVLTEEELEPYLSRLEEGELKDLPLYGIPFAIKDNIDLAGVPTTAACEEYAYTPETSAYVVERLIQAGAVPIGKTNMDQFATGLVGVRSPYGTPHNAFNEDYIPGGSSSGSAVAVARGLVSFSLGTDTAGSGRVPASFNNLVGHKPSKGVLSCRGVVPACKSLDCVSIFTKTAREADTVLSVAADFDPSDPYARDAQDGLGAPLPARFSFGVPQADQLSFFGNSEAERLYKAAISRLEELGGEAVEVDLQPFLDAALLLYEGPWVAERYVAIEEIITERPEILHPITRGIIGGGRELSAAEAFRAEYKLRALKREADAVMETVDFILTPTAGTIYTQQEVSDDPVQLNSNLGYYTNFMNLLDYAATAFPVGFMSGEFEGLPFGVTAFSPAFSDRLLLSLAGRFSVGEKRISEVPAGYHAITVCGAHLEGYPLNWQLTDRGAQLWKTTETAPKYHFYALPPVTLPNGNEIPPRPGVLRVEEGGVSLKVEVWLIPSEHFGSFVAGIPAPLGIGKLELIDGSVHPGFICEPYGLKGAQDITHIADWREFTQ